MDIQRIEYFVYILKSLKDGKHYIGYTTNIEKRLKEHNSGKTKSIKHRIPFVLIYTEKCPTIKEAKAREKQIKSYKGGQAFKKIIGSPRILRG
jgi:putative endonuclease